MNRITVKDYERQKRFVKACVGQVLYTVDVFPVERLNRFNASQKKRSMCLYIMPPPLCKKYPYLVASNFVFSELIA